MLVDSLCTGSGLAFDLAPIDVTTCVLQCLDSLLQRRRSFLFTSTRRTERGWGFYPFLPAKNLPWYIHECHKTHVLVIQSSEHQPHACLSYLLADEWKNFLERVQCKSEEELRETELLEDELRLWASYRGQTLTRTGISLHLVCHSRILL